MLNSNGKVSEITVNYKGSTAENVRALLAKECPDYKGFLITCTDEMRSENSCIINVSYENGAVMCVFAPTEPDLENQIKFFKSLNNHAKCTTRTPKIVFGQVNNGYSTSLHFTF